MLLRTGARRGASQAARILRAADLHPAPRLACAPVIATVFDWTYHALRWTWHDPDGYNFISGPLADVTLLGGAYAIYRRHNCHAKHCWRVGRHRVGGTDYIVCRKHHPRETPTAEQILAEHRAAVGSAPPEANDGRTLGPARCGGQNEGCV